MKAVICTILISFLMPSFLQAKPVESVGTVVAIEQVTPDSIIKEEFVVTSKVLTFIEPDNYDNIMLYMRHLDDTPILIKRKE